MTGECWDKHRFVCEIPPPPSTQSDEEVTTEAVYEYDDVTPSIWPVYWDSWDNRTYGTSETYLADQNRNSAQ